VEHDRRFWEQSFDRLENYLRELQWREEMAARRGAATMAEERELVITRIFDAPRSLVFKVWTAPEHLARWWGPKGFTTLSCAMDVRAGGAWVRRMRSPEGSLHTKRGIYREIVAPERLVFTYADEDEDGELGPETLVTVTFEEHGAKTRLTLRQSGFETVSARDGHYGGWTSCMERFADYLATL
jgi:uncharacterized protein YndB with AHSA1/START domain